MNARGDDEGPVRFGEVVGGATTCAAPASRRAARVLAASAGAVLVVAAAGCAPTRLHIGEIGLTVTPAMPQPRAAVPLYVVAAPGDVPDETVAASTLDESPCVEVSGLRTFASRDVTTAFRPYFQEVRFADRQAAVVPGAIVCSLRIARVACVESPGGTKQLALDVQVRFQRQGSSELLFGAEGTAIGSAGGPRHSLKTALESAIEEIMRAYLKSGIQAVLLDEDDDRVP